MADQAWQVPTQLVTQSFSLLAQSGRGAYASDHLSMRQEAWAGQRSKACANQLFFVVETRLCQIPSDLSKGTVATDLLITMFYRRKEAVIIPPLLIMAFNAYLAMGRHLKPWVAMKVRMWLRVPRIRDRKSNAPDTLSLLVNDGPSLSVLREMRTVI